MKVLLDTNVALDFYFVRQPFVVEAIALWAANRNGIIDGYVSAITPINLFYIGRKLRGVNDARQAVVNLLTEFQVCSIDKNLLYIASLSTIKDYEDAVQYESALVNGIEAIVTRDLKDYAGLSIPIYTPADFLKTLPPTNYTTP